VGTTVPQRVTLLSWGRGLGMDLRLLLAQERQLQVIGSPLQLTGAGPPADVVVVDVPAQYRHVACEQVRRHYRGRLLVLLDPEDSSQDLPPDPNRTLLTRPFGVSELSAALAGSAPIQPTGDPRLDLPRRAHVRGADSSPGTVAEVVPWLMQSWRERRLMWVATISVAAVLAFTVAVVLVTHGAGCGPACDELTGAARTAPSSTMVTGVAAGSATTDSGAGLVGPTTTDPSGGTAAAGGTPAAAATSSAPGSARTTAGSSKVSSSTSPPDPTGPPPTTPLTTTPLTTAPLTTAPSTTAPLTTAPPTTAPPTTAPPTTAPPTTAPPTTAPPTTAPPTTASTTTTTDRPYPTKP
jgi:hypothetical protein